MRRFMLCFIILTALVAPAAAQDAIPPAEIVNDEGGPVFVTGEVAYTDGYFTAGVSEPIIILEDQAGFVDRDFGYIMPEESQVLAEITSDFFTSPFSYEVELPPNPEAGQRDVDLDGESDPGVIVYAVAYWTNTWGGPVLEERDLYGGGWSTAYASTRVDQNPSGKAEVLGGVYLVWSPDDAQGFPSGFGPDGRLFTGDEPIVGLPPGWTTVIMDTDPFTFDRSREPVIDLIEGESVAQDDFSDLSYTKAFDAMVKLFSQEYAYTEFKGIDWAAMAAEYRPRFEDAERENDSDAYQRALRDFIYSIPDGHLSAPLVMGDFQEIVGGGLGMNLAQLDDGRVIVIDTYRRTPARDADIEDGAEIITMGGLPVEDYLSAIVPYEATYSTDHVRRLAQLRYAVRGVLGDSVEVTFVNPGSSDEQTVMLEFVEEWDSWDNALPDSAAFGDDPVEYELLDDDIGYVSISSFFDDSKLTIDGWEDMIRDLNEREVPGLIIDMRYNGGGSGFLARQMAAYFFDEALETDLDESYDRALGRFVRDEDRKSTFILPPEDMRYRGRIAVLVGPDCSSACEFFSYYMTLQNRAEIVGQYPTGGLAGGQALYTMPDGIVLQFSVGRSLDLDGNVLIEGVGVLPTIDVPVTEETVFSDDDVVLEAAIAWLAENP
ncbi:MAG TPA: S41 family peptidase [Aggregatilineales bacterium]|nr:S41 family peptidase [Aggregatilineales bacterium]